MSPADRATTAGVAPTFAEALRTLRVLLRELPLKQAVSLAAELSGTARNALYQRALQERDGSEGTAP